MVKDGKMDLATTLIIFGAFIGIGKFLLGPTKEQVYNNKQELKKVNQELEELKRKIDPIYQKMQPSLVSDYLRNLRN